MAEPSVERAYHRLAALEHALIFGLKAEPELHHVAAGVQDDILDRAAGGVQASPAFRSGFKKQRLRLAARIGGPIVAGAPDAIM